ncbi:FHA domain-containing protein [Emticicia sp. SJ17W-69]|uniref:FHA domain-containing protein n=1 Tax=Emticicia sp. SJ17W-69 TaxID=3421657 RepID=UPI003EBF61DF
MENPNLLNDIEKALREYKIPQLNVGRSIDNEIRIQNDKISKSHARLTQCSTNTFLLEDLDSKNGTFINDLRITRKIIDANTKIRFAESNYQLNDLLSLYIPKANPIISKKTNPLDFTEEFSALKQVYEQYPKLKKEVKNRDKTIRTGSIILSSVIGISAVLTGGGSIPILSVLSGAGLGMLIPTLSSTILSTEEKIELIEKEYREKYRCPNPNCQEPFGNKEWELLARMKVCNRCKAIWIK